MWSTMRILGMLSFKLIKRSVTMSLFSICKRWTFATSRRDVLIDLFIVHVILLIPCPLQRCKNVLCQNRFSRLVNIKSVFYSYFLCAFLTNRHSWQNFLHEGTAWFMLLFYFQNCLISAAGNDENQYLPVVQCMELNSRPVVEAETVSRCFSFPMAVHCNAK